MAAASQKGLLLRILLNRTHGSVSKEIVKSLPPDEAEAVLGHPTKATDPLPLLQQTETTLPKIHYSWISPLLKSLDPAKRRAFVACLNNEQRLGISRLMKDTPPPPITAQPLRQFYLQHLYPMLNLSEHMPIAYLPESPFNSLVDFKKNQIIELIDFLGIYDLAHEMRQIVATKNIKNLYRCLSAKQQQFLRICMHQKDRIVTPPLHLERWDGETTSLMQLMHKRGLLRLSAALSGQHPDLIWYLTHSLDIGRGQFLEKHIQKEPIPGVSETLALQVENLQHFLMENAA
jgi:hypothetical protein